MNATHTPGPWGISKSTHDRLVYAESESAFDLAIVRNGGSDQTMEANAHLIAAAPDLLTAAKAFVAAFEDYTNNDDYDLPDTSDIEAAIRKAEGN